MPEELFTKKPITIAMMLWTGENEAELHAWCGDATFGACRHDTASDHDPQITAHVYDRLHDAWIGLRTGDRVARGVKGELYPIAQAVLSETYEPAVAAMPTASGVCKDSTCASAVYRMVGSCYNCQAGPVLMVFTVGHEKRPLRCPSCGVERLHASRPARDDEVPAAKSEAVDA